MCAVFSKALAIFGTALVVKTMDDLLDEQNLTAISYFAYLKTSLVPYSLALFSLALACNFPLSFGLFWASYSLGMIASPWHKLPSGLSAITEIVLATLVMLLATGAQNTTWSFLIIAAIQLIDDFLDHKQDLIVKPTNAALLLGSTECFLATLIFFYLALHLLALESTLAWLSALLVGNSRIFRKKDAVPCS